MNVIVNGAKRALDDGASVAAAVRLATEASAGIAAAVNGQVVTRGNWDGTPLADGDQVEVLTAVQGLTMDDPLVIAGESFSSRLIMGTGGAPSLDVPSRALAASGTEL